MTKTTELKNFDYFGTTDKGLVRQMNQDRIGYFDTLNGYVFVVCDGMGGHVAGEIAAETAVNAIKAFYETQFYPEPVKSLYNALIFANKRIIDTVKKQPELAGMGTTIVVVLIRDNKIYYAHAGDSRLYLFSDKKLTQITKDHSVVQQLIDLNIITPEEAVDHPRRNEITKALGTSENLKPDVALIPIIPKNNDILLLCSDGLSGMITDQKISEILASQKNAEDKALELIDNANAAGGNDNISVQVIQFYNLNDQKDNVINQISDITNSLKAKIIKPLTIIIAVVIIALPFIFKNKIMYRNQMPAYTPVNNSHIIMRYYFFTSIKKISQIQNFAADFNVNKTDIFWYKTNDKNIILRIPVQYIKTIDFTDNLEILSIMYNVKKKNIIKINNLTSKNLTPGDILYIPFPEK